MSNVFEEMEKEQNEVPTQDAQKTVQKSTKKELSPGDMGSEVTYIKMLEVGETLEFVVEKIEDNETVTGTNKTTGESFGIGCKRKDGSYIRKDITTANGEELTVNSWELFYKLFGKDCDFMRIAKAKNTFKGIKVKITRNYNGSFANKPAKEIALLQEWKTPEGQPDIVKAEAFKVEVGKAMKENRLLTVEVSE